MTVTTINENNMKRSDIIQPSDPQASGLAIFKADMNS